MTKVYDLPKGRRIIADLDENGIIKITVQALDSLIGELNYYADKVCDIEQIRAEIEREADYQDAYVNADIAKGMYKALEIIVTQKGWANEVDKRKT